MKKIIILFAALCFAISAFAEEPLTVTSQPSTGSEASSPTTATALMSASLENVDFSVDLAQALGGYAPQDYQILEHYYPGLFYGPDRVTASLLAIVLGDLGIHHFYMGETLLGVLDILFCWTGIPGIVGLVNGIIWLCSTDEEFYQSWLARNDLVY